jgi:hypothetical protein
MIRERLGRHRLGRHGLGRHGCAAGVLVLAMLSSSAPAQAQSEGVEVRIGFEASRELISGLDAGLRAWNVRTSEQWVESTCAPIVARTDIRASVSLNWETGGPMLICFSTHTRSFQRELGPFDSLHARAREQVVTIVEAGLEALMEPDAGAMEAEEGRDWAAPQRDFRDAAWHFPSVPPPRIVLPPREPVSTREAAWTLGVGYAPAFWDDDIVAQGVSALATRSIDTARLFHLGARFMYAPAVHVDRKGVGLLAREAQAQLMFALVAPVLPWLLLETSVAPGLQWLAVQPEFLPEFLPGESVHDLRSRTHLGPVLTAQLGPRLVVGSGFVLSAQIGCSATPRVQRYGYESPDGELVPVLEVQPIRLSFELGARIGL